MKIRKKKIFSLLLIFTLFFCAPGPRKKLEMAPPADAEAKMAEAEALLQKACYVPLKQAFQIYESLYSHPALKEKVALPYLKTTILLAVREKELGIVNKFFIDKAMELIKESPSLASFSFAVDVVGFLHVKGKGIMGNVDLRFYGRASLENLKEKLNLLTEWAKTDEFFDYLFLTYSCFYPYQFDPKTGKSEKLDLFPYYMLYPNSLLIKYRKATCSSVVDAELLREILAFEPEFYEIYYFLGDDAIQRGNLLEAEENLVKALDKISESPQISILLASIYFALEEFEKSLEFYDKTLAISPEYRDALLGKAISLSYLGKNHEAIFLLENLVSLGSWLMGESHYWLAWNLHELKRLDEAETNVEQAKGRLPTSTEVFTLAGTIAFEKGDLKRAEKDFQEALQYNQANSEALFELGMLYSQLQEWKKSGIHFEKAAQAYEKEEASLRSRMNQIRQSRLSSERKERMLLRKEKQLAKTELSKATAAFNAAAGYFNAGSIEKAASWATKASLHPSFKEKADELLTKIKNRSR